VSSLTANLNVKFWEKD